jgi:hypothetical protein
MGSENEHCPSVSFMLIGQDVLRESVEETIRDEIAYE